MKKISIIVPVHNSEKYLEQCVQTIVNQSYQNIEIILVENGSSDLSWEICKKLKNNFNNVFITQSAKTGPSAARNLGMKLAKGEYIGFCDSDDYIYQNMYEKLIYSAEKNNSDYVIADMYSERIESNLGLPWKDNSIFNVDDIFSKMIPCYIGNPSDNDITLPVWGSVVRCIFKRKIITDNNLQFNENIDFAEDLLFTLNYLSKCKKATIILDVLYHYRYNNLSLMNSIRKYNKGMKKQRIELIKELQSFLIENHLFITVRNRFYCTVRQYTLECIGNCCRIGTKKSFFGTIKEVKEILNIPIIGDSFQKYDTNSPKKRVLYFLAKHKCSILVTAYYWMRLRVLL